MSGAPASVHQDIRAALLEVYQILRGAALRTRQEREQSAAVTVIAAPSRPLASALDTTTPSPSRPKATRAPLEVTARGHATKRDS